MPILAEVGDSGEEIELASPSRRSQTRPYYDCNASSLLCKLPDELLAHVLRSAQGRLTHVSGILFHLDWRHIMLVCFRIRTVALECPALWASVDFEWPKRWRELCLRRTASHTLSFKAIISNQEAAVEAGRLLPQIENGSIKLAHNVFPIPAHLSIDPLISEVVQNPAPMLQDLDIRTTLPQLWKLTSRFCAGQCQKLTRLRLHAVGVHSIPNLPILRSLTIDNFSLPSHLSHIAEFFANVPHLEKLAMRDSFGSHYRLRIQPSPHVQPTTLGRLNSLDLHACGEYVWSILRCLTLPNTLRHVNIGVMADRVYEGALNVEAVANTMEYLQRHWSSKEGRDNLPVRIVSRRLSQEPSADVNITFSGMNQRDTLHFGTTGYLMSAEDPSVQSILQSASEISVSLKDTGTARLGLDGWTVMKQVPALAHLLVNAPDPSVFMDELQAWSDKRTLSGHPIVKVKLQPDGGRSWLDWDPERGLLKDAEWMDWEKLRTRWKKQGFSGPSEREKRLHDRIQTL
jgi:hypothetical protein